MGALPLLRPEGAAEGGAFSSRRLAALLLALILLWAAPPVQARDNAVLVVACPEDAAPYSYRDADGRAAGLLPDFWRLFAERGGLDVEFRLAPASEALALVEQGQADIHAGLSLDGPLYPPAQGAAAPEEPGASDVSGLEERFAWTRPLMDLGLGLFALEETAATLAEAGNSRLELSGLEVGVVRGDAVSGYLATAFPGLRRREHPDLPTLAAALALGQVRLAAAPVMAFRRRLESLGKPERFALVRRFPGAALRAALRKDDQRLLARVNAGLAALPAEDILLLETKNARGPWRLPPWGIPAALCVLALGGSLLVLARARRIRRQAEARSRETDLLRDSLLAEMARHRKTQDLLASAIDQSPSGIAIVYADPATPSVVNGQALGILKLDAVPPHGSIRSNPPWRAYTPMGRHVPGSELPLFLALDKGEVTQGAEYRFVFPDGEERWVLANAAPVRDAQGRVLAGVCVFQDVTATRQAERDLARFKFFLDAGVEEVYLMRPGGTLAYVNEAVARSLGYARQELLDMPFGDIDPGYGPEGVYRLLHQVRQGPHSFETEQMARDRRRVLKEIKAFYMRFGEDEYICAFGRDITEKRRLERDLESTSALFAASLEQAPWGIIIGDAATGCVSIANDAAGRMLGVQAETLVGMAVDGHLPCWLFLDENDNTVMPGQTPLSRALACGESTRDLEVRFLLNGGPERALLVNASPVRNAEGRVIAAILVMADITARKRMERQLSFKALHDPLTGLPNRARCLELVREAVRRSQGQRRPPAVAFVDLDRFKMVNDSLGHSVGDLVLVEAARRLAAALEGQGRVCRFGGDEFVLLVEGAHSRDEAEELLRLAVEELCLPMRVGGRELRLTASAGIVLEPEEDDEEAESVLQKADLAMHRAKESGRDRMRLFHPGMLLRAQELMALDADMRRGLEQGEFVACYQPIVSVSDGSILGVEALARWRSPTRGLVGPKHFIPHAEESGLIVSLGGQVLRLACREMAALRRRSPAARRMFLSVNLSARQFAQPDLVGTVSQVLRESGLPSSLLKLELTESALMGDPEAALAAMRRLKALGVSLAIDDFGTGYSSLSYLQRFPVDVLKIDRAFVRDLPCADADGRALVGAISALAESLRLTLVAEGVETGEQLEILAAIGCEAVQGYLFHPPLSGPELEALLSLQDDARQPLSAAARP
ncbi:PAS domain S-box-containing protein/diguanylate cyclase (GGDEF) domain-containing protein [Humidesulfovibrio mexicanus]|uniref:PAS domain S-box-containing protein/diguanylate cyclase (GGDEF) domain-containing protein n=1 Tax=Humidesulfovibrio mexicanus TaxID=147047 RepID=A0A239BQQ0_9BACT|nr:EAL domain-containing protein [Humidesulfovibrio mexicanus]SNS09384.1 PAS domain S-box-containing protein/diguanylate cyclase (GGDEF) domain-containing protein [Humidesulfovibrio mexicanus]